MGGLLGRDSIMAHVASAMEGLALWAMTAVVTGKHEPWGASSY